MLLVDADPQANATMVLLEGRPAEASTLAHVLIDQTDAADAIRPTRTEGLDVLPSDTLLADANVALASDSGATRLEFAPEGLDAGYDFVVIDTSPQRTLINVNVLNYVGDLLPGDPGISRCRAWARCGRPSPRSRATSTIATCGSADWSSPGPARQHHPRRRGGAPRDVRGVGVPDDHPQHHEDRRGARPVPVGPGLRPR